MLLRLFAVCSLSFAITGCSGLLNNLVPDVYLVDRHTLMEADAAGEWPELEARFREQAIKESSEPYAGINEQLDEQAGFRALNAEYARPNAKNLPSNSSSNLSSHPNNK